MIEEAQIKLSDDVIIHQDTIFGDLSYLYRQKEVTWRCSFRYNIQILRTHPWTIVSDRIEFVVLFMFS